MHSRQSYKSAYGTDTEGLVRQFFLVEISTDDDDNRISHAYYSLNYVG
jgi:hypothetical protein